MSFYGLGGAKLKGPSGSPHSSYATARWPGQLVRRPKKKITWHLIVSMWVGVCVWANSGIPLRQTRVLVRPEAISGTPLLDQEFALREATVGKGLEV